jgi:hypothetical protein
MERCARHDEEQQHEGPFDPFDLVKRAVVMTGED